MTQTNDSGKLPVPVMIGGCLSTLIVFGVAIVLGLWLANMVDHHMIHNPVTQVKWLNILIRVAAFASVGLGAASVIVSVLWSALTAIVMLLITLVWREP